MSSKLPIKYSAAGVSTTRMTAKTRRPPYRAARAFYITLFIATCLATIALFRQPAPQSSISIEETLYRRTTGNDSLNDDDQCRLVHKSKDQCAFIKKHCPNEEAGFSAYLDLYYCELAHVKPVAFIILISWLGLLFSTIGIAASDFFCINLSTLATILGMSESIAGVTFLAFGNGSPDVFSTFAAMSTNSGDLAVGELFGAATFITAVVAGSMALIRPFQVPRRSFIRDVGFFVVASCFNIFFLWDGKLHFWECLVMIVYYLVYVTSVVGWHWYKGRARRKREAEATARGHYMPSAHDPEIEYQDYSDNDEDAGIRSRASTFGNVSEDWDALERGDAPEDEDAEEAARQHWMSELSANMRLTRPTRSRKNTVTPVRPSLVGALEFQAVLKSLQKSRNIQTIPMNSRRYSDDPSFTTLQQQDQMSTTSDPAARPAVQVTVHDSRSPTLERPSLEVPGGAGPSRGRAVSTNDLLNARAKRTLAPRASSARASPPEDILVADFGDASRTRNSSRGTAESLGAASTLDTPSVEISEASPGLDSYFSNSEQQRSTDRLAPPDASAPHSQDTTNERGQPKSILRKPSSSPGEAQGVARLPSGRDLPKIVIPRDARSKGGSNASSPRLSPFPAFHDGETPRGTQVPSLYLPEAVASPESVPDSEYFPSQHERPLKWWPYAVLPPPGVLISTLLPTIYHWKEKTWWEKLLGIIAAPSVFALTVTLPVVENDQLEDGEGLPNEFSIDSHRSHSLSAAPGQSGAGAVTAVNAEISSSHRYKDDEAARSSEQTPLLASTHEDPLINAQGQSVHAHRPPESWNRWLTATQMILAPLLCVMSIYIQSPTDLGLTWLIKPVIICAIISAILLIILFMTTTRTHRPDPYRIILSLAGFVVSIAWISVIAAQVVGALKALAVILNMSHAIMGLTIFAVGNSLSDLIADITVAKLGFPVMALSACFGGPMLNILLGIGVSGCWILLTNAEHKHAKHPKKPLHFATYPIEVSNTLLVSGATLLITLVGLLIAVPLNKWVMSKRIGWTLIALWILSTIANVVMEVMGVGEPGSDS